jgi:chromosome segregation ATPase
LQDGDTSNDNSYKDEEMKLIENLLEVELKQSEFQQLGETHQEEMADVEHQITDKEALLQKIRKTADAAQRAAALTKQNLELREKMSTLAEERTVLQRKVAQCEREGRSTETVSQQLKEAENRFTTIQTELKQKNEMLKIATRYSTFARIVLELMTVDFANIICAFFVFVSENLNVQKN